LECLESEVALIIDRDDSTDLSVFLQFRLEVGEFQLDASDLVDEELLRLPARRELTLQVQCDECLRDPVGDFRSQIRISGYVGDIDEVGVAYGKHLEASQHFRRREVQLISWCRLLPTREQRPESRQETRAPGSISGDFRVRIQAKSFGRSTCHGLAGEDLVLGLIKVGICRPGVVHLRDVTKRKDVRVPAFDLE
jgi:hypothetical protein